MAVDDGKSMDDVLTAIDQRCAVEKTSISMDKRNNRQDYGGLIIELCPSCGCARLVPVLNAEGLRILGCKSCRYSRIDGGQ